MEITPGRRAFLWEFNDFLPNFSSITPRTSNCPQPGWFKVGFLWACPWPLIPDPRPLTPDWWMLFWAFRYQPHLHSLKIALVRAILSHLKFSTDSCKICISGSFIGNCSQKLNFLGYEDGVGTKMLRRAFTSQGSGVRGWGSGVRGQNRGHKLR